ncbi:unnamed protein product [Arabidopsis thaliana]|uniref:Transmembrane protein n=1 Tax=Arabidopsis thaliana TaxID=3702 RepID=A0A5S9XPK8_ARATH|nr:unnamed protein product [Arabidopsis thaliana]
MAVTASVRAACFFCDTSTSPLLPIPQLGKRTHFISNLLVNLVHLDFHSPHFFLKEFIILPNTSLLFSGIVIGSFMLTAFLFGAEVRMSISPHLDSTRLVIEVGLLLDWELTLSDHFNSETVLPCIEVPNRLVLICVSGIARNFLPVVSFLCPCCGVYNPLGCTGCSLS